MSRQHYPAILHRPCPDCAIMLYLMRTHGYAAHEIDTETLRRVVTVPPEERES